MNRRSLILSGSAAGLLAAAAIAASGFDRRGVMLAQEGVSTPSSTAIDPAQMADLQTRVAELTTRVAELGGGDPAALEGRLGGGRSGFDARFGWPVAYLGPNLVQYAAEGLGRVTVTFEQGVAAEIVVLAPRPADRDLSQPDAADWTPARAAAVAAELAPADAEVTAPDPAANAPMLSSSQALRDAGGASATGGCLPSGPRGFSVALTAPDPEHVAAVTLKADPAGEGTAPPKPERAGRSTRGASAVANSSLGGTVSVNGLRMQALDVNEGMPRALPDGSSVKDLSVEISIGNQTRKPVRFDPTDFVLVDANGYELVAGCAGPEPSLARAEVPKGAQLDGWVTFLIPDGYQPEKLVVLAGNARVGFMLR
jgi:hypothetical protein